MACRKTKSLRSLTLCGMSGIDGNPPGASTSRKRMVGNVRLAFNPGRINCCKKSCASSLTPTLSLSLAPIPTGSDQNGDVTRHCGKSTTTGWERFGSSRAISRNVSTRFLMNCCSPSCEKPSRMNDLFVSSVDCSKLDISKIGVGTRRTAVAPRGQLSVPSSPTCIWINWTSLSRPSSYQSTRREPRGKPTKRTNNSCTEPLTCREQGGKQRHDG